MKGIREIVVKRDYLDGVMVKKKFYWDMEILVWM